MVGGGGGAGRIRSWGTTRWMCRRKEGEESGVLARVIDCNAPCVWAAWGRKRSREKERETGRGVAGV